MSFYHIDSYCSQISAASDLADATIIAGGALTVVLTGWLMLAGARLNVMHVLVQIRNMLRGMRDLLRAMTVTVLVLHDYRISQRVAAEQRQPNG